MKTTIHSSSFVTASFFGCCLNFVLLFLTSNLLGQQVPEVPESRNLVYNPSFEDHVVCPRKIDALGILTIVEAWYQPTGGSADYFNVCGHKECQVPLSKMGNQMPRTGNGYCGIYCSKQEYREYLQTELKERMQKGETYRLSFYVSLSEYSSAAVATVGALVTPNMVLDTARGIVMQNEVRMLGGSARQTIATYYKPQVVHNVKEPIVDSVNWVQITDTFVAKGGERFLTIGNFYPYDRSGVSNPPTLRNILSGAYYFIDDVSLECLTCVPPTLAPPQPLVVPVAEDAKDKYPAGTTIVLKNIYFEFDKSNLLQQSYKALQELLTLLRDEPKMKVAILGHTDNFGSAAYNQKLSQNRAQAVVDYLVNKGIDEKRLKAQGFGASQPIADNGTEEGRAENRRVELKILSNR